MMSVVAIVAMMAVGAQATIYCPANYCLRRKAAGINAASFECEQWPDNGYMCAFEGDPRGCACASNSVLYGSFAHGGGASGAKAAVWNANNITGGTTTCDSSSLGGDPLNGYGKVCWCCGASCVNGGSYPVQPSAVKKVAASDSQSGNLVAPKCLIVELETSVSGQPAAALWGMGVNKATVNTLVREGLNSFFKTTKPKFHTFDKDTFRSIVEVDCDGGGAKCSASAEAGLNGLVAADRATSATSITTVVRGFVDANKASFGALAALGPGMNVKFVPESWPTTTAGSATTGGSTTGSATTGGGKATTGGTATTSGGATAATTSGATAATTSGTAATTSGATTAAASGATTAVTSAVTTAAASGATTAATTGSSTTSGGAATGTAPSATAPKVTVQITINALSFTKLQNNATLKAKLTDTIKSSFLEHLPSGYTKAHLNVTFSAGSIKASVEITPVGNTTVASLQSHVNGKQTALQGEILGDVKNMPGVAALLEAGKTLADMTVGVEVVGTGTTKAPEGASSNSYRTAPWSGLLALPTVLVTWLASSWLSLPLPSSE